MSDRKVYVKVETRLIIRMSEDVAISDVINEMQYEFDSQTDGATIEDSEITDWEVIDSK